MIRYEETDNRGSITVEAAIIVPLVIMVIVILIIYFFIMYQKVLLIHTASLAAQQASEIWADSRKDIVDGSYTESGRRITLDSIYRKAAADFLPTSSYIKTIDLSNTTIKDGSESNTEDYDSRILKICNLIESSLQRGIIKPRSTSLEIKYSNSIIQGKIIITLNQEIKPPLSKLTAAFTGKETILLSASGTAVVEQPAEYIRNVDLIMEYSSRAEGKVDFGRQLNNLRNRIFKSDR